MRQDDASTKMDRLYGLQDPHQRVEKLKCSLIGSSWLEKLIDLLQLRPESGIYTYTARKWNSNS